MHTKKVIQIVLVVIAVLFVIIAAYVAYVFLFYHRIKDKQVLNIGNHKNAKQKEIKLNQEYSALTYNIGFGAYSADYSFFMDGGTYSRAYNKQAVIDNMNGSLDWIQQYDTDFVLLQEVDLNSTRSYHVNQYDMLKEALPEYNSVFAVNYDSPYLMYPLSCPHGKSKSGMSTLSKYKIESSIRRSLPIDTSVYKLIDLDRCYTISRLPAEDGKYLCIYNVHLSAYTKDESIVENQIKMLSEDLKNDYEAGNYIICGGDFNQDLLGDSPSIFGTPVLEDSWAQPFPKAMLPEGITVAYDLLTQEQMKELTPSCRNADITYDPETSFVTMVDGFLVSDNVKMISIETVDAGFAYSDHNPVCMKFSLME